MACELLEYANLKIGEPIKCDERCKKDGVCTILDKAAIFPKIKMEETPEAEEDLSEFFKERPPKEIIKYIIFGDQNHNSNP